MCGGSFVDPELTLFDRGKVYAFFTRAVVEIIRDESTNDGVPRVKIDESLSPGEAAIVQTVIDAIINSSNTPLEGQTIVVGSDVLESLNTEIIFRNCNATQNPRPAECVTIFMEGDFGNNTRDPSIGAGSIEANTNSEFPNNDLSGGLHDVTLNTDAIVNEVFRIAGTLGVDDFDELVRIYVRMYACTVLHEYGHSTLGDPRGDDPAGGARIEANWLPSNTRPDILEETRRASNVIFGEEPVGFLDASGEFSAGPLSPTLQAIFNANRDSFESVISAANAQRNTGGSTPIIRVPGNTPNP